MGNRNVYHLLCLAVVGDTKPWKFCLRVWTKKVRIEFVTKDG